jgi:hypothetical protein
MNFQDYEIPLDFINDCYVPQTILCGNAEELDLFAEKFGGDNYPIECFSENNSKCKFCKNQLVPWCQFKDPKIQNSSMLWQVRYCANASCMRGKTESKSDFNKWKYITWFPYIQLFKIYVDCKYDTIKVKNPRPCHQIINWLKYSEINPFEVRDYFHYKTLGKSTKEEFEENYDTVNDEAVDYLCGIDGFEIKRTFKLHGLSSDIQGSGEHKPSFIEFGDIIQSFKKEQSENMHFSLPVLKGFEGVEGVKGVDWAISFDKYGEIVVGSYMN